MNIWPVGSPYDYSKRSTTGDACWQWTEAPDHSGSVKVLQRVQDSLKKRADEFANDGYPDELSLLNIGRLDAVIESLGGQPSGERWI